MRVFSIPRTNPWSHRLGNAEGVLALVLAMVLFALPRPFQDLSSLPWAQMFAVALGFALVIGGIRFGSAPGKVSAILALPCFAFMIVLLVPGMHRLTWIEVVRFFFPNG
jgi:hypothetical protein